METVNRKRRFLLIVTTIIGAVGAAFTAIPFMASMRPSARARALGGPVNADIGKLKFGQMLTVEWRGKPVWIVRRTPPMLARLKDDVTLLADPNSDVQTQQPPYAKNPYRSIQPEILVLVGICTHLGCVPVQRFTVGAESGLGENWPGGYFCPCHGSKFDLAGRVFKNVPAPTNLVVPPYRYATNTSIVIGTDSLGAEHG